MLSSISKKLGPNGQRVAILLLILVTIVLFFSSQIQNYLTPRLFVRISTSVSIIALISVGQAVVVMTRNIDLSIGSVVGCTAYFLGGILASFPDLAPVFVVLLAMGIGACFGLVNGLLVSRLNLPSIIVTLATLALFRSILVESSDGSSITTGSLPIWLIEFARQNMFVVGGFKVRWMVVIALFVVFSMHFFLTRFRAGRQFYAVGSNPDAAEFSGINLKRTVLQAFLISGALAGLAGFMFLARFGNITVVAGQGLELKSVGAVVVGGVNIFGGSGSIIGVLLGATLIDLIDTSLVRWELVSEFWREAILGLLILFAVAMDTLLARRLLGGRKPNPSDKEPEKTKLASGRVKESST